METVSSRQVYANAWMTVREDTIRRADGSIGSYGVVDKPPGALIIPLDGDRLHLVEQFRYTVGHRRWEFPSGTVPAEPELDAKTLAARELREETGLRAGHLEPLGVLDIAPGMTSQRLAIFLASGLVEGEHQREHEEQDMRTGWFNRQQFETMIRSGDVVDAPTIAAYTLLLLHESR